MLPAQDALKTNAEADRRNRPFRHIPVRSCDPNTKVFLLQSESNESRLGVCYQGPTMGGADEGTVARLKSVLSTPLPAGSMVQFGLLSEPDVNGALARYMNEKTRATGLLERMTGRRIEFLRGGMEKALPGMNGVLLCRQRLIVSVTIPCDKLPTTEQLETMVDISEKMKEGLGSVGMRLEQMDEAQYLALLRRFFHLYERDDFAVDEYAELRDQVFGPGDSVNVEKDRIIFNDGEYYARALSVKHFPKEASIALMDLLIGDPMGSANQMREPFWMVTTMHYPDQHDKVSKVRMKYTWVTNQSFGAITHLIPILKQKKAGMDVLIGEMDTGGAVLVELNFSLFIFSRDDGRANGMAAAARAWAASYGFELREDKRILKELLYLFLPMSTVLNGIKNLHRFHTLAVAHAIHLLPVLGNWSGTGSGGASILMTRRGTVALFDPYDSSSNYNGVIAAGSGAGKSVLAQQLMTDWLAGGARVWAIDQGRSYQKMCAAHKGSFIEFSDDSELCLNPFTNIVDIDDEMDMLKAMFAKMAAPREGLDDFGMAAMEAKIMAAYSDKANDANVDDVADQCLNDADDRIQDLGRMLYPYTRNGGHGRWFYGANNVDLDNDFVVLEMKELATKPELQQVVMIQLFANIGTAMYHHKGRKKYMVIDEAWALINDPVMGNAVEVAYRTVRKHKGGAWLITQSIGDMYESAVGRAIISSSAFQLIMQQKADSIENAIKSNHLRLHPYEAAMMKSVRTAQGQYSEIMIRADENWGIARLVVDRFSQIMFSTSGWERDEVLTAIENGEDVVALIDNFIEEGR